MWEGTGPYTLTMATPIIPPSSQQILDPPPRWSIVMDIGHPLEIFLLGQSPQLRINVKLTNPSSNPKPNHKWMSRASICYV